MTSLEARIQRLEDRVAIQELIAAYGPIVDSGAGHKLEQLWDDEGEYIVGEEYRMTREEIPRLTELPGHQEYLAAGCSHFLSPATIQLDEHTAEAVNYSVVLMREGDRWVADRLSANHWWFARTDAGWRVTRRQNALLNGDERARALLEMSS